jgi:hypothetical protein
MFRDERRIDWALLARRFYTFTWAMVAKVYTLVRRELPWSKYLLTGGSGIVYKIEPL